MSELSKQELRQHLNQQTAKINWQELERFFAQGSLYLLEQNIYLIEVAADIIKDNKPVVEALLTSNQLKKVNDEQAALWQSHQIQFWAVVAAPYVLIQVV